VRYNLEVLRFCNHLQPAPARDRINAILGARVSLERPDNVAELEREHMLGLRRKIRGKCLKFFCIDCLRFRRRLFNFRSLPKKCDRARQIVKFPKLTTAEWSQERGSIIPFSSPNKWHV